MNAQKGTINMAMRHLIRTGLVALAIAGTGLAWAVPQPKVTVEFSVTNGNQLLVAPAEVDLSADAFARQQNHPIVRVEFYSGTSLIGSTTTSPYTAAWNNVPAGSYSLTAKAIDDKGDYAVSTPVQVSVDAAPTVSLTAPAQNASYIAPAGITLNATAADSDGSIAKVDFYQGSTLIGTATGAPFSVTWNGVSPGGYTLTAVATDHGGTYRAWTAGSSSTTASPTPVPSSPTSRACSPSGCRHRPTSNRPTPSSIAG